jgi:hypothetical protein
MPWSTDSLTPERLRASASLCMCGSSLLSWPPAPCRPIETIPARPSPEPPPATGKPSWSRPLARRRGQPRDVRLNIAGADAVEHGKRDVDPGRGCEIVVAEVEAACVRHQPEIVAPASGRIRGAQIDPETGETNGIEPLGPALPAVEEPHAVDAEQPLLRRHG